MNWRSTVVGIGFFLGWAATVTIASPHNHQKVLEQVPPIAHLGDIVVGRETLEGLSSDFGNAAGTYIPGGHPTGGRAWFIRDSNLLVNADGFNYDSKNHRIIDSFSLSISNGPPPHKSGGIVSFPARQLAFMGTVLPGMKRETVLQKLASRLPKPLQLKDGSWDGKGQEALGWRMSGKSELTRPRFTSWEAKLLFENGTLVEIDVECD